MNVIELPLLHDHHNHVSLYAALDSALDLAGLTEAPALRALAGLPRDRLSLAKGWRSDRLRFDEAILARLPPVLIINFSLHGFVLSPSALPLVEALWPEFAARRNDVAWTEAQLPEIFSFYGRVAGLDAAKLAAFMAKLESLGIASAEDLSTIGAQALEVIATGPFSKRIESWATQPSYMALGPEARSRVKGFKVFLDGSIGARNAAIVPAFLGGERGLLLHEDDELSELLAGLTLEGKPIAIHAIGQRAIEQALRSLEGLSRSGPGLPPVRLEHVQFIEEGQAFRARDLGLCLSMQPNFNADSLDYADRLPQALLASNNPFRMLIDKAGFVPGKDLLFGSDGMPHGSGEALRSCLFPPREGQRLRVEELVAGYGGAHQTGIVGHARFAVDEARRSVERLPSEQA
jgi:predicted amidohydrolase YtcJ